MTANQIKALGIKTDAWASLENSVNKILFVNEGGLYPTVGNQYYFDTTNGFLFVRLGDYVDNGNTATITYADGGIKDSKIGLFHEVYDSDMISMILLK